MKANEMNRDELAAFPRCNWASGDGEETESMMLEWLRGVVE